MGNYEHLAFQSGNQFTIEIREITAEEEEERKKDEFGYSGERLSLNFQDIEVRSVLQLIADFTGFNIVVSDTVSGSLTLRLKNVPWDQALDIILQTKALGKRQAGNVIMIAPAEEIANRERIELEGMKQKTELAPLRTEYFQANYAKAAELATLLQSATGGLLTERGSVTVDERTNTLLINDTTDQLEEIRALVHRLDVPIRQVLIESRIVIASDDFNKDIGVRWGLNRNTVNPGGTSTGEGFALSGNADGIQDLLNGDTVDNGRFNINLPGSNAAGSLGVALAKLPFGTLLELELSAMQAEGTGEVISSPRVITANQHEAYIEQGVEIPYLEASSSGATSVSFRKAVLGLTVTPQITPDDRIVMDLKVNKDTVGEIFGAGSLQVPSIDTREVSTQVLVDNGETVVLGGVYEQSILNKVDMVPFFGNLPLIGRLFQHTTNQDDKSELLVFVTPKIIEDNVSLSY
jgi:type IV pilus assembly protein PilQ